MRPGLALFLLVGLMPVPAAVAARPQIDEGQECGAPDLARATCEVEALHQAETALAAARRGAARVIAAAADRLEPDERKAWATALNASVTLWLTFRDARCDKGLIDYEVAETAAPAFTDARRCAQKITRAMAGDISFRYDLETGAVPRESATQPLAAATSREGDDEQPCLDVDPGACDYCGANQCWEDRLVRADRDLNWAWTQALKAIRDRPGLAADRRADWIARLRRAQRAWLAWRDAECALEPWETPNRFAHSIYATLVAPCLEGETLARISDLGASYRLGGR